MKILLATVFLMFLIWGVCLALGLGDLPFGMQMADPLNSTVSGPALDSLKSNLGINVLYPASYGGWVPYLRYNALHDSGFEVIPYMTDSLDATMTEDFQIYLNSHYIIIGAGDDTSGIRFYCRHGSRDTYSGWFVAPESSSSFVFLDSLYYLHEWDYLGGWVDYQPFLFMRLMGDSTSHVPVAIFSVFWSDNRYWTGPYNHTYDSTLVCDTIWADDFSSRNPDSISLSVFSNHCTDFCANYLIYQIKSTGQRSFAIKWLKVYNENGKALMEDHRYDAKIQEYAGTNTNVYAWQLRDDMKTDQMMPAHRVDSLIWEGSSHTKRGMMKYCDAFVIPPKDFIKVAHPKRFWIDPYQFYGGMWTNCEVTTATTYYGEGTTDSTWSLQWMLDHLANVMIAPIRDAAKEAAGDSIELWYMAQMQASRFDDCSNYYHRRPTASEMRCEASLALACGVDAIQYWPYDTEGGPEDITFYGLCTDVVGHVDTTIWNKLYYYVTPYLQSWDQYLKAPGMHWERSYNSHHTQNGYYVYDVSGWSDSYNPDSGWAQIGEFHKGNDKYIMLVNRACNVDSVHEALRPIVIAKSLKDAIIKAHNSAL
jgi:hypothetical protein